MRFAAARLAMVAIAAQLACRKPTEITLDLRTDVAPCSRLEVAIAVGAPGALAGVGESSVEQRGCVEDPGIGHVGSLVLVPSGDKGAKVEIRVVGAVDAPVATCAEGDPRCITARRILRFDPHEPLSLQIALDAACLGVNCGELRTCSRGSCYAIDPDIAGSCPDPDAPAGCTPLDAGADADAPACPSGRGPAMQRVSLGPVGFCIDSTEVSVRDYKQFLDAKVDPATQPAECRANTTFVPDPAFGGVDLPVVNLDWCDARAYCAWAGKRLCGRIGGGPPLTAPERGDATRDEWYFACTYGGKNAFGYGSAFDRSKCGPGNQTAPRDVGAMPSCVGEFPGIFDMPANVHEWADDCDRVDDSCGARGGAFDHPEQDLGCAVNGTSKRTGEFHDDFGFRCCAN